MALNQAKIKSVLSGDTLILCNVNNPKQERTLSLAYVTAPRLRREGDEPFAFESREFLRKALVGQTIRFRVLYTIPTTKREYGVIHVANGAQLPEAAVTEGWVKLREDAGRKEDSEESQNMLEKLQVFEARARADSKGLWSEDTKAGRIDAIYELPDAKAFVEQHKDTPIDAIVEKVLSGDRLISRLLVSPTQHVQTILLIGGIRSPATKRINPSDGQEQPAEPFGDEAQQYAETRLLQRSVKVQLLGVSPQGQLIGTVKHPTQGSIAPFLLRNGLARCMDPHSTLLGSEMGQLRQAEKEAKDAGRGVFTGHVAPRAGAKGELEAVVSRVFSADTLFVRNKQGAEKRINLSSVRQPKPTDPKQSPFSAEAKEFLRKKLIGKHVKVIIDGKRAATEGYEEREMATVSFGKENVGMVLVENGYASVIRHRQDDPDRSPIYDDLLLAEQQAQSEGKGMWAAKPPSTRQYVDYSESLEKAKRQVGVLSRQKKVPAVVDFVKSGSRFTILIPRENAKVTLVLSGIRAPRSARNPTDKAEPFGQEAHDFANKRCLQRDVEIDVEDVDKVGGFIGALYINRENFAKLLLEEGFASVHQYSAEKSGNANELNAAEKKAKELRKGMWHNWDPSQDHQENGDGGDYVASNGDSAPAQRQKDYRNVGVTHVDENSGHLKIQTLNAGNAALRELMTKFGRFHISNNTQLAGPPKAGDFVSAKFTADDTWYRAKIRRNDRENKKAEVLYIDYGNSETIPWSRLRPLDADYSTQTLKAQAQDAVLSFVQLPGAPQYLAEAVDFLREETLRGELVANVDWTSPEGTLHVTLFDPENERSNKFDGSLNADLIAEGLAMVPKKLKPWERASADVLASLKLKQKEALDAHRGMWEYGDPTGDDE